MMNKPNELQLRQCNMFSQTEKPTLTVLVTNAKRPVVLLEGLSVAASDTKEYLLRLVKCEGRDKMLVYDRLRSLVLMNFLVPLPHLFKLLVRNTLIKPKIVPNFTYEESYDQKVSSFCRSQVILYRFFTHSPSHTHAHTGTCLNV